MKIWDFAYFLKIKTMGISPTLGVDTTTTPILSLVSELTAKLLVIKDLIFPSSILKASSFAANCPKRDCSTSF